MTMEVTGDLLLKQLCFFVIRTTHGERNVKTTLRRVKFSCRLRIRRLVNEPTKMPTKNCRRRYNWLKGIDAHQVLDWKIWKFEVFLCTHNFSISVRFRSHAAQPEGLKVKLLRKPLKGLELLDDPRHDGTEGCYDCWKRAVRFDLKMLSWGVNCNDLKAILRSFPLIKS